MKKYQVMWRSGLGGLIHVEKRKVNEEKRKRKTQIENKKVRGKGKRREKERDRVSGDVAVWRLDLSQKRERSKLARQCSTPSWRERLRAVSCPTRLNIHKENEEILHSNVRLRAIHRLEIL